ncbi:hypothetical protein HAX54_019402 [Datura stramonium]|uniref:Uncharacterized protein n=1 Tax=Datura stramonium TaxID=4076 RepID=A0ABS8S5A1_DATST|nr:hypothetical protein [Datura stramonium]
MTLNWVARHIIRGSIADCMSMGTEICRNDPSFWISGSCSLKFSGGFKLEKRMLIAYHAHATADVEKDMEAKDVADSSTNMDSDAISGKNCNMLTKILDMTYEGSYAEAYIGEERAVWMEKIVGGI